MSLEDAVGGGGASAGPGADFESARISGVISEIMLLLVMRFLGLRVSVKGW